MKRKLRALAFVFTMMALLPCSINAQNDAFFSNSTDSRTSDVVGVRSTGVSNLYGNGFRFNSFNSNGGLSFDDMYKVNDSPITDGLFIMAATGLCYLFTKRRKEDI